MKEEYQLPKKTKEDFKSNRAWTWGFLKKKM
jgi:hypothetical protein